MAVGKGLQALIPPKKPAKSDEHFGGPTPIPPKADLGGKSRTENIFYIEIKKIKSNPHQPRKNFDKDKLQELADSIKEHGILQPLVVTKLRGDEPPHQKVGGGGEYQLIVGERRLSAAKIAGLSEVPVIIRDSSEQGKLEIALVENLQRDNLNPIERAYAFKELINEFNFTQQNVAKRIGKSRESVSNTIRLLELPAEIQRAILEDKITEGHGRVILSLSDIEKQLLLFKEILKNGLSVRQAEAITKKIITEFPKASKIKSRKDSYLIDLEDKLSNALATRVKVTRKGKKGKITIEFFSQEELNSIIKRICKR